MVVKYNTIETSTGCGQIRLQRQILGLVLTRDADSVRFQLLIPITSSPITFSWLSGLITADFVCANRRPGLRHSRKLQIT
ncbi:hypothetical protein PoB_004010600 [Plakobranchus ocellatus]|uniref:Uncharacterized protein n=1 Tax=Plakobranchus ocellatus TaxID=259542 RepID=A0AAV4AR27_9GAST|nr:hypothetical protein PoB_004010600 [Plakobranchus ocellatus]